MRAEHQDVCEQQQGLHGLHQGRHQGRHQALQQVPLQALHQVLAPLQALHGQQHHQANHHQANHHPAGP